MNEVVTKLAMKCGGLREPGMRGDGIWVFTEPDLNRFIDYLYNEKDKEIQELQNKLFVLSSQMEIYKGALLDSY